MYNTVYIFPYSLMYLFSLFLVCYVIQWLQLSLTLSYVPALFISQHYTRANLVEKTTKINTPDQIQTPQTMDLFFFLLVPFANKTPYFPYCGRCRKVSASSTAFEFFLIILKISLFFWYFLELQMFRDR